MSTVRTVINRRESDAVAISDSQVREGLPEQLTFGSRDLKEGAGQENTRNSLSGRGTPGPNSREKTLRLGEWWVMNSERQPGLRLRVVL